LDIINTQYTLTNSRDISFKALKKPKLLRFDQLELKAVHYRRIFMPGFHFFFAKNMEPSGTTGDLTICRSAQPESMDVSGANRINQDAEERCVRMFHEIQND